MDKKSKRPFTRLQKALLVVAILSLALVVLQALLLLVGHFQMAALMRETGVSPAEGAAAIGIIGGADGPTAIYVASVHTNHIPLLLLVPGAVGLASGIVLLLSRRKQRNANNK